VCSCILKSISSQVSRFAHILLLLNNDIQVLFVAVSAFTLSIVGGHSFSVVDNFTDRHRQPDLQKLNHV